MGEGYSSVSVAGGVIYTAGAKNKGWFCLDFKTGKQMWNAPGKGAQYWAHPVVSNGVLYLRHVDKLFAYDVKRK